MVHFDGDGHGHSYGTCKQAFGIVLPTSSFTRLNPHPKNAWTTLQSGGGGVHKKLNNLVAAYSQDLDDLAICELGG